MPFSGFLGPPSRQCALTRILHRCECERIRNYKYITNYQCIQVEKNKFFAWIFVKKECFCEKYAHLGYSFTKYADEIVCFDTGKRKIACKKQTIFCYPIIPIPFIQ